MLRETTVENGRLRGIPGADPRVTVFRGIPFAAPPVGKNRWRAPQPCRDWNQVKRAHEFAPIPVQDVPGLGDDLYCREFHVDPEIAMGEDCLYLNVWTPAKSGEERMPVLVWFFGGAFQWGYTAEMEFDGERLARRGIVVVSVSYRLGALGFLAHPELTQEAPDAPANFGLLDQQAGLDWVRRNIGAFGGDPDSITIAGQSAGGASVMAQMTCESNYDKIRRAVVFSGMIRHPEKEADLFCPVELRVAESRGEDFFHFLGVKNLAEARALDAYFIRDRYAAYAVHHPRMVPVADGVFMKGDPMERFIRGERAKVPVMSGWTADEFIVNGTNIVERSVCEAFCGALKNKDEQDLYSYCFQSDIPGWDSPGCFHSADLWFFFETLGKCWRPFVGRHYDLARRMCNYFANFIKNGDPNGTDVDGTPMPEWRPWQEREGQTLYFSANLECYDN